MADQRVNVSATDVTNAVLDTLRTWLPVYIAEQERLEGRPARQLAQPRSFVSGVDTGVQLPEDGFPCVAVTSPGLSGNPVRSRWGVFNLTFGVAAGVFVVGSGREQVQDTLRSYVAAIRICLLEKGVTGLNATVDFTDETYDLVPGQRVRSLAGGETGLSITIENAVVFGPELFPDGPPEDPYEEPLPPGTVQTVVIDIEREEITQ